MQKMFGVFFHSRKAVDFQSSPNPPLGAVIIYAVKVK
jgi:hypothetical protein